MLAGLTPIRSATSADDSPRLIRALRKWRAKFEWRGNALTPLDVTGDKMVAAGLMNKDEAFDLLLMITRDAYMTDAERAFAEEMVLKKSIGRSLCRRLRLITNTPDA
jgi:hypothetical protein